MRVVSACFVALLLAGCGGSDDDDSNGTGSSSDWSQVTVPSNIDATSCKAESSTYMNGSSPCHDCCEALSFSTSSTIFDDHCTCGNDLDDGRDSVCASETATSDACETCCEGAGFSGHGWVGGTSPLCQCFGKSDREICAATVAQPNPGDACAMCCVEQGYVSMAYVGIGEPECNCISP